MPLSKRRYVAFAPIVDLPIFVTSRIRSLWNYFQMFFVVSLLRFRILRKLFKITWWKILLITYLSALCFSCIPHWSKMHQAITQRQLFRQSWNWNRGRFWHAWNYPVNQFLAITNHDNAYPAKIDLFVVKFSGLSDGRFNHKVSSLASIDFNKVLPTKTNLAGKRQ